MRDWLPSPGALWLRLRLFLRRRRRAASRGSAKQRPFIKRPLSLTALLILLILVAAVSGLLEEALRRVVQSQGSRLLQAELTLDAVDIDLLPPGVGLEGLRIYQPNPYVPTPSPTPEGASIPPATPAPEQAPPEPSPTPGPDLSGGIEVLSIASLKVSLKPTNLLQEVRLGHARLQGVRGDVRLKSGMPVDLPGLVSLLTPAEPSEPTPTPLAPETSEPPMRLPDLHLGTFEVLDVSAHVRDLEAGWSAEVRDLEAGAGFFRGFELSSGRLAVGEARVRIGEIDESLEGIAVEVLGEDRGRRLTLTRLEAKGQGVQLAATGWVRLPPGVMGDPKAAEPPAATPSPTPEEADPLAILEGWAGRLSLDLGVDLATLARFVPDAPPLVGDAAFKGEVGIDGPTVFGEGVLTLAAFAIDLDGTVLKAPTARLPLRGNRDTVTVEGGVIGAGAGELTLNAEVGLTGALPVKGTVGLSGVELGTLLGELSLTGSWVTAGVDGEIALSGAISPFTLKGDVDLSFTRLFVLSDSFERPESFAEPMLSVAAVHLQGPLRLDDEAVYLDQALITAPKNRIFADLRFDYDLAMDLRLDVSEVDLDVLGPIAGLTIKGEGWGRGRIWGPLENLMIGAHLALIGAEIDFLTLGDLEGTILVPLSLERFVADLRAARMAGRTQEALGGFKVSAQGVEQLIASSRLVMGTYYPGQYSQENDLAVLFIQDIEGAYARTPYAGHVGVYFGEPLILNTEVEIRGGQVADLLEVGDLDLGEGAPLKGDISADVLLTGPIDALDGRFTDVVVAPGSAYGEIFERLEVDGRLEGGDLYIDRAYMEDGDGRVLAAGSLATDGGVALTLKVQGLPLMDLDALIEADLPVTGQISGDLTVLGELDAPMIQGRIEVLGVAYGTLNLGEVGLDLQTLDSTLVIDGQLGELVLLNGELGLTGAMPLTTLIQVQDLPLDPFLDLNAKAQRLTSGVGFSLQAKGELNPSVGEPPIFVDARLDQLFVDRGRLRVQNYGPAFVQVRDGAVRIRALQLVGPGTDMGIQGDLGAEGALDITAEGQLNLALLDVFLAGIFQRIEGTLTGPGGDAKLHIGGTTDAPILDGDARLEQMAVRAEAFPQTVDSISSNLKIRDNVVHLEDTQASMGGGRIDGGGELRLGRDLLPYYYDLEFEADEVVVRYPDYLPPAEIHGVLALQGEGQGLLMTGDLVIDRAVYRERINWEKDLLNFRPNRLDSIALVEEAPPLMGFAIQLKADETLYMRNNVGNLQMSCDLLLEGDTNLMGVTGTVSVDRGKVYLLNTELDVVGGEVTFLDYRTFNPYLDLTLETEVQTYTISYQILGSLEDYQISSSSDAGLSERDINSLLAFGVLADDLSGSSASAVAQPALEFIAGSLGLQEQVEGVVPLDLDRFGVVPVLGESGSTSVRFYGEKELKEDKLTTSFHYDVGVNQDYRFQLEYTISDTISVVGDADQGRQFNARRIPNIGGRMKFSWSF